MFESKSRRVGKGFEIGPKMSIFRVFKKNNPFISIFFLNTKKLNVLPTFHKKSLVWGKLVLEL